MAELSNVTWGEEEEGRRREERREVGMGRKKCISTEEKKIKKEVRNAGSLTVRGERKRGEKSEI